MVRTRFAPSPTGFLHIGGLRTALYSQLFALRHGGVFVLRIEDTDRARTVAGGIENIIRTLAWAEVVPDEGPYLDLDGSIGQKGAYGPYIQSERFALYQEHAQKLVSSGAAYHCFCSAEDLEAMKTAQTAEKKPVMYDKRCRRLALGQVAEKLQAKTPHVIRLKVPEEGTTAFEDAIRGQVSFQNQLIDDQVLVKSDGFPTYHLANVVDDHRMEITHVIRGEEWLPSTPKHLLLYAAFGWTAPQFAHLPLLLNADRSKLSKRQGDVAVEDYAAKGYLPEAIVNFVALLGWNPSADREIFAKSELVREFSLEKINKAGAVFNIEKLDWMNGEYIKRTPVSRLASLARPFYEKEGIRPNDAILAKAVTLEQMRIKRLAELPEATRFLFEDRLAYDVAKIAGKKSSPEVAKERLRGMAEFLTSLSPETFDDTKALEAASLAFIKERAWTNAETLWPTRYALSAREASPSPFELAWALGRERTLGRLEDAIKALG